MRVRSVFLAVLALACAASLAERSRSYAQTAGVPAWLAPHIGEGSGQIARPVLERARALYSQKTRAGVVRNPCYFAMDATRPNDRGAAGARFYTICESQQVFRAVSAGHGGGHNLKGIADYSNGMRCAKNFGNALDSELTAGGPYVTAETKTSFKGYYRAAGGQDAPFSRTFLQFEGEGETATARVRAIGGHAAVTLKGICLRKDAADPYADPNGYVRHGKLVDYTGGRSNGCTSWSPSDARQILAMVQDSPTTLYIYPDQQDVEAVARATGQSKRAGPYWNAACLKAIRAPRYWSRARLEPLLAQYRQAHPEPPPQPPPLCAGE